MKKSTLMKMALAAVAMFVFVGLNAQILTNYQNVAEDIYQTQGKTFRVYVMPDLVYSPGYNAGTNSPLGAAARWTWTYPAGLTTGAPATGTPANQNWVEFTNPGVGGPWVLSVVESTTLGIGCADATPETRNIFVIAAPTATITSAALTQFCGNTAAQTVAMSFTENVPAAFAAYAFAVSEVVETIDPSDAVIASVSTNATFVNFPTTGKLKVPALVGAASPYTYSFSTSALNLSAGNRTRYTYTLVRTPLVTGGAAAGVVSAISEKSDVIGGTILAHAFSGTTTVSYIVNPSPVTGPIFHIPNNFAY